MPIRDPRREQLRNRAALDRTHGATVGGMAFVGSSGACVRPRARRTNCKRARSVSMALAVGTRVRVAAPIDMFHYPGKRNVAFNVEGLEGEVAADVSVKNGVGTSATKPYLVTFTEPKFRAHFDEDELEAV